MKINLSGLIYLVLSVGMHFTIVSLLNPGPDPTHKHLYRRSLYSWIPRFYYTPSTFNHKMILLLATYYWLPHLRQNSALAVSLNLMMDWPYYQFYF